MTTDSLPPGATAGALLRAARERQGLHIAALAAAIKVAPRKLDALENDRWDELPDATFARALAQTVCRTLKIDSRPVLELLPAVGGAALEHAGSGLNMPFRQRPSRGDPAGTAGAAIRPMLWAAGVLMVAAVAVYLMPAGWLAGRSSAPASVALPASAPASAVAVEPVLVPAPGPGPAASAPVDTPPAVAAAASAAAPAAAASVPSGIVQLRASGASWVEARDARGSVLLFRTLQAGETVGLDGALPIRLTIGNVAGTQLAFRGQPVDLASKTSTNVVKLELQ